MPSKVGTTFSAWISFCALQKVAATTTCMVLFERKQQVSQERELFYFLP